MKARHMVAALWLAAAAAPALAQSAGEWKGPEQIWGASCGYCHDSGVGPPIKGARIAADAITAAVRQGLPGMPSFHPSEIDDRELATFSRWLSRTPPVREAGGK